MMAKLLEWDSGFLGLTVGEVDFSITQIDEDLDSIAAGYDLLYVFNTDRIFNSSLYACSYEEFKIVYSKQIKSKNKFCPKIFNIRDCAFDVGQLYNLAFISGEYSRFRLDHNFKKDVFFDLYRKWIDNSLNQAFADIFFIYVDNGEIAGCVTGKINSSALQIGILAVSPQFQGKGVGKSLIYTIENYALENKITDIKIPTQLHNKKACLFYEKIDYAIDSITNIKHYWKI